MAWWMWLLVINGYIGVVFATYTVLKITDFDEEMDTFLSIIWPIFLVMVIFAIPVWLFDKAFNVIAEAIEHQKG